MWHVWGKRYMYTWFWCVNLKARCYLEDLGVNGRIILKGTIKKWDEGME